MFTFKAGSIADPQVFQAWCELGISDTLKSWISRGVQIPFIDQPQSFVLPNHKLSKAQVQFVDTEIKELLAYGSIEKCSHKPFCVSPIGVVPKKSGKSRLITDLRRLNQHCRKSTFRYEDIKDVANTIQPNDLLITADIKNGFNHVLVHTDSRDFLGFQW